MITIFNRKLLLSTMNVDQYAHAKDDLAKAGIVFHVAAKGQNYKHTIPRTYNINGKTVTNTGLVYDFKAVVGSTKQRAEQTIEVDGKSYAVSITVDFVDARRTDEYCTLTYVVDCPVDYNGALFYVGGDIKEAGTEKEFNNETEISQTEEQSWFQEGHLEEDASGNQVYVMNGKWFTVFIEE